MDAELDLATVLEAGNCLIGARPPQPTLRLKDILQSRLVEYHQRLGRSTSTVTSAHDNRSLEDLQSETAHEALYIVEHVHNLLIKALDDTVLKQPDSSTAPRDALLIGARDLAEIRTLLSITFKWGTELVLDRLPASTWSKKQMLKAQPKRDLIDLTTTADDLRLLASLLSRILNILFSSGREHSISQTPIANIILTRHMADILGAAVCIAWLPKSLSISSALDIKNYQEYITRLLSMYVFCKIYSLFHT